MIGYLSGWTKQNNLQDRHQSLIQVSTLLLRIAEGGHFQCKYSACSSVHPLHSCMCTHNTPTVYDGLRDDPNSTLYRRLSNSTDPLHTTPFEPTSCFLLGLDSWQQPPHKQRPIHARPLTLKLAPRWARSSAARRAVGPPSSCCHRQPLPPSKLTTTS